GHALIAYDTESASFANGHQITYPPDFTRPVTGADNEVAVNAALWDVVDTPSTPDATPGVDDDPLALTDGPAQFWEVFTNYIPTAPVVSAEAFWNGWFRAAHNHGHLPEMQTVFGAHGMEYFPDVYEPDGAPAQAHTVVGGSPAVHHTFYSGGDADWFIVGVQ